ncbi:PAS domain-containing sensor histidine kinase [Actinoplanes hulinensis]|uniref:Sensor-like histidine kinase SenX3 n=1 Tax=Actinoplanes hulinensis TaxID=1144547 RepID=A0ABS7B8C8_9ACTN|nr:PAS domain-containing sensor histidine kinase [Actinoplanes hulinensis]MBW6437250.1 PAS domain-containing sensor histidine kinase [Actinoplanes hulinensis]
MTAHNEPAVAGVRASLLRTAGFASAFLLVEVLSRAPFTHTDLYELWPSVGVVVMWFVAQLRSPVRWVDPVVLVAVTVGVNLAAGQTVAVAAVCALVAPFQVGVYLWLSVRGCSQHPGVPGRPRLRRPADLWPKLAAAAGAATAGAVVGFPGLWAATGTFWWSQAMTMLISTAVGMVICEALAQHVAAVLADLRARHGTLSAAWRQALREVPGTRVGEYLAVIGCSAAAYSVMFSLPGVSMVFPLLALTVWAAVRLCTTYVLAFSAAVTLAAGVATLYRSGPFVTLGSAHTEVLVAHVFAATSALIGLTLALIRDERATLTLELTAEKEQASRQAGLMNAIIDSMSDGMGVHDRDGQLIMHNPALVTLLGRVRSTGTQDPVAFYGLHHINGTPIPEHDLPWRRVAADRQTHVLDMLVRNPDLPHDRILRCTAAPVIHPDGYMHRTVVLIHDVTAETRHRDALASFAGVVAHDLLNPLTTIEGWTEAADDALEDVPEHPCVAAAHGGLVRVKRAAARMRGLVNDLLAYTTTRDAALTPAVIDLNRMVTDVAGARIDTAVAAGTPVPTFTAGDLHPMHADPVLVRQLLDNLVSNAVKYTAADVTPHITISSSRMDDTVAVTITDNGIGIPAGQHDAVFDTFHRAHRGQAYSGTGLGLSICKRTVERHGGTITASDNPGGGTRFTFTLPAVAEALPAVA